MYLHFTLHSNSKRWRPPLGGFQDGSWSSLIQPYYPDGIRALLSTPAGLLYIPRESPADHLHDNTKESDTRETPTNFRRSYPGSAADA
jgi:hypothetical protein